MVQYKASKGDQIAFTFEHKESEKRSRLISELENFKVYSDVLGDLGD